MTDNVIPTTPAWRRFAPALLAAGAIALALGGATAGWLVRGGSAPQPAAAVDTAPAAQVAQAAQASAEQPLAEPAPPAQSAEAKPAKPAPVTHSAPRRVSSARTAPATSSGSSTAAERAPMATQPVEACAKCGVVEAVRAVQQKGEGSGVGAVAGGVLGAVVGNQVGKGSGRTAMTVLGAIGGGLAGNEVEKRTKTTTVYEVRVRMDDGTLRTVTQSTQPVPGTRVVVEGQTLRAVGTEPAPRTLRTSSGA